LFGNNNIADFIETLFAHNFGTRNFAVNEKVNIPVKQVIQPAFVNNKTIEPYKAYKPLKVLAFSCISCMPCMVYFKLLKV